MSERAAVIRYPVYFSVYKYSMNIYREYKYKMKHHKHQDLYRE